MSKIANLAGQINGNSKLYIYIYIYIFFFFLKHDKGLSLSHITVYCRFISSVWEVVLLHEVTQRSRLTHLDSIVA